MAKALGPDDPPDAEDVLPEAPPPPPPDPTQLSTLEQAEFQGVLYEIASRRREALKLFEPMPEQERFFSSDAEERIALGGNRGGKTTVTTVEVARAVTGQDPHGKYPAENGRAILVGKDLTHCGKVWYRKLFKPGAFKIIRDEETGLWRTFRPNDPADQARADEARPAPPLIPRRMVESESWENKKDEIPKTIRLKNGWELCFFSSLGAPPQGWDVDLVAFDEEIEHPLWYPEMSARLLDRRQQNARTGKVKGGKFIWSATPQAGTQQLYDLKCRADECRDDKDAPVVCFEFGMLDNPFVSETAKQKFIAKFEGNEDEIAVRVHGKFALLGTRVYSEFMPKGAHGIDAFPIPEDWTVYAAIDPGRQVCAVLFAAVPPPGNPVYGGQVVVFAELYIKRCNALIFAQRLKERMGHRPIEVGIIDHRAGRITEIGSGRTHEQQYSDALKKAGFRFERNKHGFAWSSDDVKGGIEAVHNAMHIVDGRSRLVVMRDKVPNLLWEMERYAYRKLPSGAVTDEPIKINDHLCDCLRYLFMYNLRYVKPRRGKGREGYVHQYLKAKKERAAQRKAAESGWGDSVRVG
jgi:hypothetical protein